MCIRNVTDVVPADACVVEGNRITLTETYYHQLKSYVRGEENAIETDDEDGIEEVEEIEPEITSLRPRRQCGEPGWLRSFSLY